MYVFVCTKNADIVLSFCLSYILQYLGFMLSFSLEKFVVNNYGCVI
jgi:hypothetical protein